MAWNSALNNLHGAVLDTFGTSVMVNGQPIKATFDRRYIEIPSGEAMQAGYAPILECSATGAASVGLDYGAPVTVGDDSFTVVGMQPDGAGWLVAILEES